jgi:hypothetical protein
MQAVLELSSGEKWHGIGRLSMHYGSRMLQSLILIDALVFCLLGGKKKKEKEMTGGFFSQGRTCLAGLLHGIFVAVRCN